ncbi:MAG: hypothetical protein OXC07_12630 [Kistimonas sp.]|nr:hypothetical protein [Kistimonas sp.]
MAPFMIRQRGLACVGGVSTCAGVGAGGGGGFLPGVLQELSRELAIALSGARFAGEFRRAVKTLAAESHHSDAQEHAWAALTQNQPPCLQGGDLMIFDSPRRGSPKGLFCAV